MKALMHEFMATANSAIPDIAQICATSDAGGGHCRVNTGNSRNAQMIKHDSQQQQEAINYYAVLNQIGQRSAQRRLTEY